MKSNTVLTAMEKLVLIKIYTLVIATACCVCVFSGSGRIFEVLESHVKSSGRKEKQKQQETLLIIIP